MYYRLTPCERCFWNYCSIFDYPCNDCGAIFNTPDPIQFLKSDSDIQDVSKWVDMIHQAEQKKADAEKAERFRALDELVNKL